MAASPGGITLFVFIIVGVFSAIYGGLSGRVSASEAMLSILISIIVPVIGGVGVAGFILYWRRNHSAAGRNSPK